MTKCGQLLRHVSGSEGTYLGVSSSRRTRRNATGHAVEPPCPVPSLLGYEIVLGFMPARIWVLVEATRIFVGRNLPSTRVAPHIVLQPQTHRITLLLYITAQNALLILDILPAAGLHTMALASRVVPGVPCRLVSTSAVPPSLITTRVRPCLLGGSLSQLRQRKKAELVCLREVGSIAGICAPAACNIVAIA